MAAAEAPIPSVIGPAFARRLPRCGEPHPKNPKYTCMRSPEHGGRHQLWRWESDTNGWQVFLENFPED